MSVEPKKELPLGGSSFLCRNTPFKKLLYQISRLSTGGKYHCRWLFRGFFRSVPRL